MDWFSFYFSLCISGGRNSIENGLSSAIVVVRKRIIVVGPIVQFKFNNQHQSSAFLESWLTVTDHIAVERITDHETEPTAAFQSYSHGRMEIHKVATGTIAGCHHNRCARVLLIVRKRIDDQQRHEACHRRWSAHAAKSTSVRWHIDDIRRWWWTAAARAHSHQFSESLQWHQSKYDSIVGREYGGAIVG